MPKLDSTTAKAVNAGADKAEESSGFEVLPEGMYTLRLRGVEVKDLATSKEPKLVGQPQWVWEFEIPEGLEHAGRRFWANRILPPAEGYQHSDFMFKKFAEPFVALGGTVEDDTDDLIGRKCQGYIIERTITAGARSGEQTNALEELLVLNDEGDAHASSGATEDSYDF